MSDEPKSILASLPLPGVLAILTAVAGTVLVQYQPLTPRRPPDSALKPLANPNPRKIDSALLEDPFAILNRVTFSEPGPASLSEKKETTGLGGKGNSSSGAQSTVESGSLPPAQPPIASNEPEEGQKKEMSERSPLGETGINPPPPVLDEKLIKPVVEDKLRKEIISKAAGKVERGPGQLLVIPAIVRPFHDNASVELRARVRQALVQALYASGYAAADPRFLECLRITNWNAEGPQPSSSRFVLDIPFEWFVPNEQDPVLPDSESAKPLLRHRGVLVLWINNKQMGQQQLARLRELLGKILPPDDKPEKAADNGSNLTVRALGPFSTEQLGYLAEEAKDIKSNRSKAPKYSDGNPKIPDFSFDALPSEVRAKESWPGRIEVFSHSATGSAESVLRAAGHEEEEIQTFRHSSAEGVEGELDEKLNAKAAGRPFIRTINTDDRVAQAMLNELERRFDSLPWQHEGEECMDGMSKRGRIAIISEMDSPYGRELPAMYRGEAVHRLEKRIKAAVEKRLKPAEEAGKLTRAKVQLGRDGMEISMPWFPYIRGLDGRGVLALNKEKDTTSSSKPTDKPDKDYRPDEEPRGPN